MEGWGPSKQDYYGADEIETEADALMQEQEAIRLQKKQVAALTEADFGFDPATWQQASKQEYDGGIDVDGKGVVHETLPMVEITDSMSSEERHDILRSRYPEFEPLANTFVELQAIHEGLESAAAVANVVQLRTETKVNGTLETRSEPLKTPIEVIKYRTVMGYLAALSMYFAIFTSSKESSNNQMTPMDSAELRDHRIMETLLQWRRLWVKVKDLAIPDRTEADLECQKATNGNTSIDDVQDLDHGISNAVAQVEKPKRKRVHKSKIQRAAETAQAEADARRAERLRKTEEGLAELSALTDANKRASISKKTKILTAKAGNDDDSDIGEQTALTAEEAAEKARRKRSLRFYTSQIAQKANKRDTAGRDAGGDADIPYRERLKDRQARLNAEAENRGRKKATQDDPLDDQSDDEDRQVARDLRDAADGDYYDLIASQTASKKADRKALGEARTAAEKEGGTVRVVEATTADGKRAISYAIEKNKGLAPKRKKEVRNPRVKKRKKFEEKKKKLGSIRQVYKGGEGRGGYGGELTGIKTGLVRSVKL